MSDKTQPCTTPLIDTAMQASRQHMFTILAVHAFLDSVFAEEAGVRAAAHDYLLNRLPADNSADVSVTRETAIP